MADESELRMEGLKKAYAEIILNASKEAAARVMASERRALCFQNDLVSLKEESLRMLLRLKENFNCKITEAEAKSLNQQMKIEELEAQLCEAEGIIVDLRGELKRLQEQLEITRHNPKNPLKPLNSSPIIEFMVPDSKLIPVDDEIHGIDSTNLNQFRAGDDNIPSIILQNRDTDLYRNGRIHAFERNLSNMNLASRVNPSLVNVQSENTSEKANHGQLSNITSVKKIQNGLERQLLHDCSRSLRRSTGKNGRYKEAIAALRRSCRSKSVEVPIEVAENKHKNMASLEEGELFAVPVDVRGVDSKLVDVPVVSDGFGNPFCSAEKDKLLKFTFHRKRRKNVLAKVDANIVSNRSTVKRRLDQPTDASLLVSCGLNDKLDGDV